MSWQDNFQIDGGRKVGWGVTGAVAFLVLLTTAGAYFHHERISVQVVSDQARERIMAMKHRDGG